MRQLPKRFWVGFHRVSAAVWGLIGIGSFWLGWQDNIAMVWIASVYANLKSDWGAAEAADDSAVLRELHELRREINEIRDLLLGSQT